RVSDCTCRCRSISVLLFFFSSRRRHTRSKRDWSSDVCSSDLPFITEEIYQALPHAAGEDAAFIMRSDWPVYNEQMAFPAEEAAKIGRASCRERGGMTVVAEAVEKKEKERGEGRQKTEESRQQE